MIQIEERDGGVLLPVKVVPGASRDRFAGEWDGRAKIAVAAPPEGGRANKAVCAFIANLLGIQRRDVRIVAGEASPLKTLSVTGVTAERLRASLEEA
ncbi:MAG: hypothetical protein FLDDKLPJ_02125 [Phycisphaerae bacterium]|nr:hypothetical protein [Phycisphaerae bacterium]